MSNNKKGFCTLCSTYILETNCNRIVFRKGKAPVVVCKWCNKKIMEVNNETNNE